MRVKIPRINKYIYPDITVVCGEDQFEDNQNDTLLNPVLIIEILSEFTEAEERSVIPRATWPQCGSMRDKRNGRLHLGQQKHSCQLWGRAFVLHPEHRMITEEQRALLARLRQESIALY